MQCWFSYRTTTNPLITLYGAKSVKTYFSSLFLIKATAYGAVLLYHKGKMFNTDRRTYNKPGLNEKKNTEEFVQDCFLLKKRQKQFTKQSRNNLHSG